MRLVTSLPSWQNREPGPKHVIGVLPGEGVGPELIDVACRVFETIAAATPHELDLRIGNELCVDAEPDRRLTREVSDFFDSIFSERGTMLCGPVGGRFVYELRARFDLFCKFTPVRPLRSLEDCSGLKSHLLSDVDLVVIRENAGGLYLGEWERTRTADGQRAVTHRFGYDERQVTRILDVGLRLARMRRRKLCLTLKPGGLPGVSELWSELLRERAEGQGVEAVVLDVGNAAYQLVAAAQDFDVVVAPNMIGDILSDSVGLLLGSRGVSFSGNFGADGASVYQTGHGAAWDLAGSDRANPVGQILSVAMLLRESCALADVADALEAAIERTLASGYRTADVAAPGCDVVGTRELGLRICDALEGELARAAAAS
jgi:3-isopropylmalate dehydrogenase